MSLLGFSSADAGLYIAWVPANSNRRYFIVKGLCRDGGGGGYTGDTVLSMLIIYIT